MAGQNSPVRVEEATLLDLLRLLWKGRRTMVVSIVVALVLAFVYLTITPRIFRTQTRVMPPSQNGLILLNLVPELMPKAKMYDQGVRLLMSKSFRRNFFNNNGLYEYFTGKKPETATPDEVTRVFDVDFDSNLLVIGEGDDPTLKSYVMSYNGPNPKDSEKWINEMVARANEQVVTETLSFVTQTVESQKAFINRRIDIRTEVLKEEWKLAIDRLEEAEKIARKINLPGISPAAFSSGFLMRNSQTVKIDGENSMGGGQVSDADDDQQERHDYLRGYAALKAESDALRSRKDPATYSPLIRSLRTQGKLLDAIKVPKDGIRALAIDEAAFTIRDPVKPRPILVLFSALILGLFLGLGLIVGRSLKAALEIEG